LIQEEEDQLPVKSDAPMNARTERTKMKEKDLVHAIK
jgi:hypothetical protein